MQHKKTAKLGRMKPTVKRLIFHEAIRQRDVPREILANRIIKELEESNEPPPELETAKRYISKARNAANPIDKPWTLGACRDYPGFFPPSSLPTLMKMLQVRDDSDDTLAPGLSIRECIWIVRLEPIIHEIWHELHDTRRERQMLSNLAHAYALAERTSDTMGEQAFDSYNLDVELCARDLNQLLLVAAADKDSGFVCDENCDACKYEPLIPGKLCHLRGLQEMEDRIPDHYLIRKPPKHPNKEGE